MKTLIKTSCLRRFISTPQSPIHVNVKNVYETFNEGVFSKELNKSRPHPFSLVEGVVVIDITFDKIKIKKGKTTIFFLTT